MANGITIYLQGETRMEMNLAIFGVYLILMIFIGVFSYKHQKKITAQTEKEERENQYQAVLKNIADSRKEKELALMNYGAESDFSAVPIGDTWQLWIRGLVKTTDSPDLDYYNFGNEFYFWDLGKNRKIKIPTGNKARTEKVGDSIQRGMVLRLMPNG